MTPPIASWPRARIRPRSGRSRRFRQGEATGKFPDLARSCPAAAAKPRRAERRPARHGRRIVGTAADVRDPLPRSTHPSDRLRSGRRSVAARWPRQRPRAGPAGGVGRCSSPRPRRAGDDRRAPSRRRSAHRPRWSRRRGTRSSARRGSRTSSSSRTRTSASRIVGIVSKASRSAPASTSASIRGRWKVGEGGRARVVVAAILRAVREHRAVRPDGAGDEERPIVAGCLGTAAVAGPLCQHDALLDQPQGAGAVDPRRGEAVDRRLVRRPSSPPAPRPGSRRGGRPRSPPGRSAAGVPTRAGRTGRGRVPRARSRARRRARRPRTGRRHRHAFRRLPQDQACSSTMFPSGSVA